MSVTDDAFLGGRLNILQPRQGYRAGLDAVMLAAAVEARGAPFRVLDAGAGVGTAGLCVAWRCPEARVVLVEREPELVRLAEMNIARNGLQDRVSVVEADVTRVAAGVLDAIGLAEASFDQVIANPPYHTEGAGTAARDALKAAAHAMPGAELEDWWRFFARMAKPGGEALMIHKASALPDLIDAAKRRFGALVALPLHSRAGEAAHRVMLGGIKGSRAAFRLDAGFAVHDAEGAFTPGAEDVLRLGRALRVAYGTLNEADAPP
ncbi:MAG TPA: methyltransferase [Hyphomicrobium sp.]|nr:methyltransferase [Hyphomicrobium sp.]